MSSPEPLGTPSTIHAILTSPSTSPITLQSDITRKFLKYRVQLNTFIEIDPNDPTKERCRCKSCRNSEIKFQSISTKQSKNNHMQKSEHQLALAFLLIDHLESRLSDEELKNNQLESRLRDEELKDNQLEKKLRDADAIVAELVEIARTNIRSARVLDLD
jgi:hypothetical protein